MQVIRSFLTTHRLHDDEKKRVYEVREKVEFYTIKTDPQKEMSWVYSATEFQNVLNKEFDEAIAAEAQKRGDLPQDIYFYMDNGVLLKLCEDCNEYFYIELEKRVES